MSNMNDQFDQPRIVGRFSSHFIRVLRMFAHECGSPIVYMTKRLQAIGNSAGLIIDNPILELLRITPETDLASAGATPANSYDGQFLHDDLFHMAAAYAFHIAENQPETPTSICLPSGRR